jgi:O-antigen/teichoic acid export membrane protein
VLFGGKYGDGLVVLPWTMTYCIWLGLASIAQTWLWCHDRASLGSLALVLGVVLNVVLNLLWLPSLGLLGAVLATSAANLLALGTILFFAHRRGLPVGAGTIACMLLPAALPLGAGWSIVILALVAALALTTPRLLSAQEREILGRAGARFKEYIPGFRGVPGPAA